MIKDHLNNQAENLRQSYYNTLSTRKDYTKDALEDIAPLKSGPGRGTEVTGANLIHRAVPGVGVVLNGNWYTVSGTTSCLLQDIGYTYIDFNAMNGTAPDAFSLTDPISGQYLGTVDQPKRMQLYTMPRFQYSVPDSSGTTYYTQTVGLTYNAYIQNIGWQGYVSAPNVSGTTQALRIQAIQMYGPSYNGGINLTFNDAAPATQAKMYVYYRVLVQDMGWMGWVSETEVAGTTTQAKRLQAMQVRSYLIKI